ncbi:MAG TPA: TonB-dependent receptor [Candidatus Cybelea sp.]|nr:TonB-dependent receptor [Candidatus Cybelea sp.]
MFRRSTLLFAAVVIAELLSPRSVLAQAPPPSSAATLTGNVVDANARPVPNAEVVLTGPQRFQTHSDAHGTFAIAGVPYGEYRIDVTAPTLGHAQLEHVAVGGDTSVAVQFETVRGASGLKVIGHVSTSNRARINLTPESIATVTPADFANQSETLWRRVFQQIPGVSLGYSYASNNPVGSPLQPQVLSIDGTLPYETATLVDGMPIVTRSYGPAAGNGIDLAQYDPYAFSSYDIIRGPSAQSPTILNAVGGTLDMHTPGLADQTRVFLTGSNDAYGGFQASLGTTERIGKFSLVADYGVNDSPGPFNAALTNFQLVPSTVDGQPFTCTSACSKSTTPSGVTKTGFLMCCINASTAWSLHSGSIDLGYAISPAVTAQVFYTGQRSETGLTFANTQIDFAPPSGYNGSYPAGSSYIPNVYFPYPTNGIYLTSSLLEEKLRAQVGKGEFHAAALSNMTSYAFPNLWQSQGHPFRADLYGGGDVNGVPTVFNGESHVVTVTPFALIGNQFTHDHAYTLGYQYGPDEGFHAGLDYVQSVYDTPIDYTFVSGSFVSKTTYYPQTNFQETQEYRLRVGGPVAPRVDTDLSVYFTNDRYHVQNPADAVGTTYVDKSFGYTGPRFGAVWHPSQNVAFRTSLGGAFTEPYLESLVGTNGPPTANNPSNPTYYTQSLTNVNLKPETSFGFTIGTDVRVQPSTVVSLDAYRTNLWGQFYEYLSPNGTYQGLPLYADQTNNLTQSRYEGVVTSIHHDVPRGPIYRFSLGFTRGYVVSVPPGFYGPNGKTTNLGIVPGVNFNGAVFSGVSIPYSQASAEAGYRWNPSTFAAFNAVYLGSNNAYYQPAFVVLNLNGEIPLSPYMSLRASFQNITGVYDQGVAINNPANTLSVPIVAGLPATVNRQQYGPRTIVLTTSLRLF